MLKRSQRLYPTKEAGRIYPTTLFSLRISKNLDQVNKFGFVISKKVAKQAVIRNQVKRRLSTCIQESKEEIKVGNNFLFYVKKEAALATKEELCTVLLQVFKTSHTFKEQ